MVGRILLRGLLAGLIASLLCFVFLKTLGEPAIERAIAIEAASGEGHHHEGDEGRGHDAAATGGDEEVASRSTQSGIGLLTAVVLFGTALGGIVSLAYAGTVGRVGSLSTRGTALTTAVIGFLVAYVVPSLKYPANPPAVGDPATLNLRTACFFLMIACSLAGLVAAGALRRGLLARLGDWDATVVATAAYAVAMGVVFTILPSFAEAPAGFPAELLWRFRLVSFGGHAILWLATGLMLGAMVEAGLERRTLRPGTSRG